MGKRVFISSASGAIAPYRRAAAEMCVRLGLTPVQMETFSPDRLPPIEVCLAKVDQSDIFLLLAGHRYGSRPNGESRSYTELEYDRALQRPEMPLLVFSVDLRFPWDPQDIADGADADNMARFRLRIQRHLVRHFAELAEFKNELILALLEHTNGSAAAEEPPRLPAPPAFHAAPPYVGSATFTGRAAALSSLDEWGRSADPVMVVDAIGGTGKSALTWQWATDRATEAIPGLRGRMWWSFYEGSASMIRFLRESLAYLTERPLISMRGYHATDLTAQLVNALRSHPYLIVLDGVERLLGAFHRFDPTKVRDDEVEVNERGFIDPLADEIIHLFAAVGPSKILISTRLMPSALEGRFGRHAAGVRRLSLPGLTDEETVAMLADLGVHGGPAAVRSYFGPLDNHPLLIGIVAGLVRRDKAHPCDFDGWLTESDNESRRASSESLVQPRTRILATALDGLSEDSDRVLGYISALPSTVDWNTLLALSPFRHYPGEFDQSSSGTSVDQADPRARLVAALEDLEQRGLLWWDRSANSYDLHPVIRAHVYDRLRIPDRISANNAVRDHFEGLPPDDVKRATSVEDLRKTITIFRSHVGGGEIDRAAVFWQNNLSKVMLVGLGANSTVVELLSPIAAGQPPLSEDLARATRALRRYDPAIDQTLRLLDDALDFHSPVRVGDALDLLGLLYRDIGSAIRHARCLLLQGELLETMGYDPNENPTIVLRLADIAVNEGRFDDAELLLNYAMTLPLPRSNPYHNGDLALAGLRLALAGGTLTETALTEAEGVLQAWPHRAALTTLRRILLSAEGRFDEALKAAEQEERLARNAGRDVVPAVPGYLLARLGRRAEAEKAVQLSLNRLPRLHPALRPHHALARALMLLDQQDKAAEHAREAYQQAWQDGPPHCHAKRLSDAEYLLRELAAPLPELRTVDVATVSIPLQEKVMGFIGERRTRAIVRRVR